MMNLNAYQNAEQIVARLSREAVLNTASHIMRLELATAGFSLEIDNFEGAERDYVIGVIYSMNEQVSLLKSLGGQSYIDALLVGNLDAKAWYDKAINTVHKAIMQDACVKEDTEEFSRRWEIVQPTPKRPANADQLDMNFAEDDVESDQVVS